MELRLQLLRVAFVSVILLFTANSNASDPEAASVIPPPVFEDGFEVFVGCGDGLVLGEEACDDNNQNDGDGCSSQCEIEPGFLCFAGDPSFCTALCGDGLVKGLEQCDDMNQNDGDGCSSQCEIEPGFGCFDGDPSVCTTLCGDGLVRGEEECDDMNGVWGDGCDANCNIEHGYECSGEPSICTPNT